MSGGEPNVRHDLYKSKITNIVGVVNNYMANPGQEHWHAAKRIFRFVKGTSDVALCYKGSDFFISGFVDADYVGNIDKSNSTTRYVFTLNGEVVSWV